MIQHDSLVLCLATSSPEMSTSGLVMGEEGKPRQNAMTLRACFARPGPNQPTSRPEMTGDRFTPGRELTGDGLTLPTF